MPDWAGTRVVIKHKNPDKMQKVLDGIDNNRFFETTRPLRDGENFGVYHTKWEPQIDEVNDDFKTGGLRIDMLTAWYAPLGWFERMVEDGYKIDAWYADANQRLVHWRNGDEVRSWTNAESKRGIPKVIQAVFHWFWDDED